VGSYRAVITVVLSKNKITVEEKRMLRGFRRTFSITDEVGLSTTNKNTAYLHNTRRNTERFSKNLTGQKTNMKMGKR